MRELVIVIADLYLPPESGRTGAPRRSPAAPAVSLPAIEDLTRFARVQPLRDGWRDWVARWLRIAPYAGWPPASVAAAAVPDVPPGRACWLATPLHLTESLAGLHLDLGGVLCLGRAQREQLAADFNRELGDCGFALAGLESGEFLLSGPEGIQAQTTEPARLPVASVAESLPTGTGAPALRRLGAEIEMWLYDHPLNRERARRGEAPVSTLWIWGGGLCPIRRDPAAVPAARIFGSGAWLAGLCRLTGIPAGPEPETLPAVSGDEPTLAVLEIGARLRTDPGRSVAAALAGVDARLIGPACAALRSGELGRLTLIANDRAWTLRASDRWRLWRRRRAALEALA